jgi:hypothetical protein
MRLESMQPSLWDSKQNNRDQDNDSIALMIKQLLRESFAAEQKLGELTMNQVGDCLMQTWESIAKAEDQNNVPQRNSFEKCRELYCELLWQLEVQNREVGLEETLSELKERGDGTQMVQEEVLSSASEIDPTFGALPHLSENDSIRNIAVNENPTPEEMPPAEETAPSSLEDTDVGQTPEEDSSRALWRETSGQITDLWEEAADPSTNESETKPEQNQNEATLSVWDDDAVASPTPGSEEVTQSGVPVLTETSSPEKEASWETTPTSETGSQWEADLKPGAIAPSEISSLSTISHPEEGQSSQVYNQGTATPNELITEFPMGKPSESSNESSTEFSGEVVSEPPTLPEKRHTASSPLAKEYIQMAEHFIEMSQRGVFPFPIIHLEKITAQNFCFAMEAEWIDRVIPSLNPFWSNRATTIPRLLDKSGGRFDFHLDIKNDLVALTESHQDWLLDGKFPFAATLTSLRYLAGISDLDKLKLSLLDIAVLLMFFGCDRTVGEISLSNELGAQGLSESEIIELSFRLLRIQKIKSKALSISQDFKREILSTLTGDMERVFSLMHQLKFGPDERGPKDE